MSRIQYLEPFIMELDPERPKPRTSQKILLVDLNPNNSYGITAKDTKLELLSANKNTPKT